MEKGDFPHQSSLLVGLFVFWFFVCFFQVGNSPLAMWIVEIPITETGVKRAVILGSQGDIVA